MRLQMLENAAAKVFTDPADIRTLADLTDRKSMVELGRFLDQFDLPKMSGNTLFSCHC